MIKKCVWNKLQLSVEKKVTIISQLYQGKSMKIIYQYKGLNNFKCRKNQGLE